MDKADASIPMLQNLMSPFIPSNTCPAVLIYQFHFHFYTTIRGLFSVQCNTENRIKLKLSRALFSRLLNSCFSCNHVPSISTVFTINTHFFAQTTHNPRNFSVERTTHFTLIKPNLVPRVIDELERILETRLDETKVLHFRQLVCHFGDLLVCLFIFLLFD